VADPRLAQVIEAVTNDSEGTGLMDTEAVAEAVQPLIEVAKTVWFAGPEGRSV